MKYVNRHTAFVAFLAIIFSQAPGPVTKVQSYAKFTSLFIGTIKPAEADENQITERRWEPAGFGGAGNFLSVHFDPHLSNRVYALSDVAGIYRTKDSGNSWESISFGLGNLEVSSFAVDPFDSDKLYVGVGAFAESHRAGIWTTEDGGQTWRHLESSYVHGITFRKYRTASAIALDYSVKGAIISGSRKSGLCRSTDGGQSWTQVYTAPTTVAPLNVVSGSVDDDPPSPYPAPVSVVVFDPSNAKVVYAGLDGIGVLKSTSGGIADSWQSVNDGLPLRAKVKDLAVGRDGELYAAVEQAGIYRSVDGGNQWGPANGGLPLLDENTWVSSVAIHPDDAEIAYLTLATFDYANVWKSSDGGANWVPQENIVYNARENPTNSWAAGPTLSWKIAINPHNPEQLFYSGFWEIYRSDDGGGSWESAVKGAQNTCVTDLFLDIDRSTGLPARLFATHMDAGLLTSADAGKTWAMVLPRQWDEELAGHYWRFATAQTGETKYYYTTSDPWDADYGQVLRSADGQNWIKVLQSARPPGVWFDGAMLGLAVDPPSTLYVTQDGGQVLKSTDSGDTWSATGGQPGDNSFTYALAVDGEGRIFAGTLLGGLWRSEDGGRGWQRILNAQESIFHLEVGPGAVYASAGDANLYKSTDGGNTWKSLTSFSTEPDGDPSSENTLGPSGWDIAIDPLDPNHILYSRLDTWHPADAAPGVVESFDGGVSWQQLNTGLGLPNVSALAVENDDRVFAGTWCGGVWGLQSTLAPTAVERSFDKVPNRFSLAQNRPNPFNPTTMITYEIPSQRHVNLKVYNVLGAELFTLVDEEKTPGQHEVWWNAGELGSGVYFYRLKAGRGIATKKDGTAALV